MKKIIVTGGGGYIGSHVVKQISDFSKKEYEIHVIDIFTQSRKNILNDESIFYHETDIRNRDEMIVLFKKIKPELVMHFAALASVPDSMENPAQYYETNVSGTLNLVEAMRLVDCKKMIFSSSASIYGEPETEEITEDHPKNPTNPYGFTKLIGENILKSYYRAYGISSVSFRYFCAAGNETTYTLGEYHEPETHAIPSLILTSLGKREEFKIYGNDFATPDGTGIRDYIHVEDLAAAHIKAIDLLSENDSICEQYNLGINKGFSVKELVESIKLINSTPIRVTIAKRRDGDPSRLIANASKAMAELHWTPAYTDISKIIETSYQSFKKHV